MKTLIFLPVLASVFVCIINQVHVTSNAEKFYIPESGRVGGLPIRHLCQKQLEPACDLLQAQKLGEAGRLFEAAAKQDTNDLIAFVGLAQAKPTMWRPEIDRLESEVRLGAHDPVTRFKLGTLLLYDWASKPRSIDRSNAREQLDRSVAFLENVWRVKKTPIVGFMLCDGYDSQTFAIIKTTKVMEKLIKSYIGDGVCEYYENAKTSGWRIVQPPMDLIPATHRREMYGILRSLWAISSIDFSKSRMIINGKVIIPPKVSDPVGEARTKFLFEWAERIRKSEGFK